MSDSINSVKGSGPVVPRDVDSPLAGSDRAPPEDVPGLTEPLVMENLGLEGMAAMLLAKSAQDQLKLNREGARAASRTRVAQLLDQHFNLRKQAESMKLQASVAFAWNTIGVMCQAAGGDAGKGACDAIAGLSNKRFEAHQKELEADATLAGAQAKEAESDRDEYNNNVKAAEAMLDKAHQALESFVAERTATRRAILKS
jgi:hypothetical protein